MIVRVERGGVEVFSYDTDKQTRCICPGTDERETVADALREAEAFVSVEMIEEKR